GFMVAFIGWRWPPLNHLLKLRPPEEFDPFEPTNYVLQGAVTLRQHIPGILVKHKPDGLPARRVNRRGVNGHTSYRVVPFGLNCQVQGSPGQKAASTELHRRTKFDASNAAYSLLGN